MVSGQMRLRGPARSPLSVFLRDPRARAEAAALAALCALFEIPIEPGACWVPRIISLEFGERLCETYEAYCASYPKTEVQLEELIVLRSSLAKGNVIRLGKCRSCKCLIVVDRYESHRECFHCDRA